MKYIFSPQKISFFVVHSFFVIFFVILTSYSIHHTLFVFAQTLTPEQKAKLEQELIQVLAEQKQAEQDLTSAKTQSLSITRDISVLTAKIKLAQLNIKAKNLLIENLGKDIRGKENHIETLDERILRGKDSLSVIMRKTNEVGSFTLPEVLLSQSSLTGVFKDIDTFSSVQDSLKSTFEQIRSDKSETEVEKGALEKHRNAETDARYTIQQEEKNIKADEKEKQGLLAVSKGNEKSYSNLIAQKATQAAQIRATLFPLAGGGQAIPFGDAYKYALEAQGKTGVRAAFLLAIFAQESSVDSDATFGKNVGLCYLANKDTGDGIGVNTKTAKPRTMHPKRDVPPFLEIVKAIGGDPYATRVSCWIPIYSAGSPSGWGGAMGPAQFIASTWMLFKDRVAEDLGISTMPNPWDPRTAFMAASIYLSDLGAYAGSNSSERTAACKYYSGAACGVRKGNTTYGNSVIAKAENIQRTMIDLLAGL